MLRSGRILTPMTDQKPCSILDYLTANASQKGERPAIICGDHSVSYRELIDQSANCRGALQARGIERGDRVALVMCDGPEWVLALIGIISLGALAVPCSTMAKAAELTYILNDCGAKAAIITPDQFDTMMASWQNAPALQTVLLAGAEASPAEESLLRFERLLAEAAPAPMAECSAETPALILYTSGSTGQPKGAVHRHGDFPVIIERCGRSLYEITDRDRLFSSSRLFFAYGLGNSFSLPLGLGATSILCRERPAPPVIARILKHDKPTVFFAVPAVFRALLEYRRQGNEIATDSIRFCVSAGESLPAQIFHEWKEATGLDIIDAIGSTELFYMFISNRCGDLRPGSSGVPVDGYDIRLIDERGGIIDGAGRGDLYVKGASALACYWNKPEKTAETISDGWVKTGDVYRRDEEGYYWFEGRSDDLFKSSGLWVSPGDVEAALCSHPAVLEAAVIAEPSEDGTNLVAAYVVLRPGIATDTEIADQLMSHASGLLSRYKQPRRIYFLDQLPRTATGKMQRFKLRGRESD
jgi:benzoate-CoA ligase family protein